MKQNLVKQRQHQVREDIILEAARDLLAEVGFEAMTMDDLANRVGISKATLYQHFASKDDLALAVVLSNMQQGLDELSQPHTGSALARLETTLKASLERRSLLWSIQFKVLPERVLNDKGFLALRKQIASKVETLIDTAKKEGDVARTLSTPVLARMFHTLMAGHYDDLLEQKVCTPSELAETIWSVLFAGVEASKVKK